jgi:hypothetical protein
VRFCNRPRYLTAAAVLCNRTCLGDTVARRWSPSAADVVSAAQFDGISQGFWEFWESKVSFRALTGSTSQHHIFKNFEFTTLY